MEGETKEQTPVEIARSFINSRKEELEAAIKSLDAGDFRAVREAVNSAASNLPNVFPLLNQAQGLPAYPHRDILGPED